MRVGLDISSIVHGAGIGRYTALLADALNTLTDKEVELFFFSRRNLPIHLRWEKAHIRVLPSSRLLYHLLYLGMELRKEGVEVFHSPDFLLPLGLRIPGIITVHDLSPWDEPESVSHRARILYRWFLPASIRKASRVVVDSGFTRSRLCHHFPQSAEKVQVVYPGISSAFKPLSRERVEEVLSRYHISSPYALFVGTLEERKNFPLLSRVVEGLQKDHPIGLVVVGRKGSAGSKILSQLQKIPHFRWVPHLNDEDLCAVYSGCALFLFPSRYEGFGYPPLEAMACGAPVVASRVASLPESVGEGGILVEPEEETFLKASRQILSDASFRESLIQRGKEWVKRFPASATAVALLSLYRSLAPPK